MKDKEKQIEEMARIIMYCPFIDADSQAKALYDKGYRKLPEDRVVLTETERITMCVEQWDKGYAKGSKETAEKIYLQAKAIVDATKHLIQGREYLHIDALKEIVKFCGVELKE